MKTVLITGGTGLIGQRLSHLLNEYGYKAIHLSRRKNPKAVYPTYTWDIEKQTIDLAALKQADYIVHLAGAGIADKRWTEKQKQLIINSRTQSTQLLQKTLQTHNIKPKAIIAASAIGYYGNRADELLTETAGQGKGFAAEVVEKWETAVQSFNTLAIRTCIFRVGIVLSTKGGALSQMLPSYKVRIGAYFGKGHQYYSWIHIDDLCKLFIKGIEEKEMEGIYNAVAPNPVTNKTLAESISTALNQRSLIMSVPSFALKFLMGEMVELVLNGAKVSAEKVLKTDFYFDFETVIPALEDLVKRKI